jgi:hypothetical protein
VSNPWERVLLNDYEEHMKLDNIQQLQILNQIMKKQIKQNPIKSLAILGIAGGNGLEYIDLNSFEKVYGIDVNQNYLDVCKKRYSHLDECLTLLKMDLTDLTNRLPDIELIIGNLLIEYIGIEIFIKQLAKVTPKFVSCVVQKNVTNQFVSDSPYLESFMEISDIHNDIDKVELTKGMKSLNYMLILEEEYLLPNSKKFIRLDYKINE